MPLSDADLNKIGELFDTKFKTVESSFKATIEQMGKRLHRLEVGFNDMSRVARSTVIANARKDHDRLLRSMFDESTLVAVPPLTEDQSGNFSRPAAPCTQQDVKNKIANIVGDTVKFEVEPSKVGYRILMASFSPQTRRKMAAQVIKEVRKDMSDTLGLYLQYDKPYELRLLQKQAYKFLSVVKKRGGEAIQSKQLKNGFIIINGVRIAPEYLVPGQGRWDHLADVVVQKIKSWKGRATISPEGGALTDVFGYAFAADRGVFELDDVEVESDDTEPMFTEN
jgi:hypothetical protein